MGQCAPSHRLEYVLEAGNERVLWEFHLSPSSSARPTKLVPYASAACLTAASSGAAGVEQVPKSADLSLTFVTGF